MPYEDIPYKEDLTLMNRLGHMLKSVIMAGLAIYTIIVMFNALAQVTRKDLLLTETPPNDRCVKFFDSVKAWREDNKDTSSALYDFRAGEAVVRICTSLTEATVDDKIGKSYRYNPWVTDGECDVLNNAEARNLFLERCIPGSGDGYTDTFPACSAFLGNPENRSVYYMHWNHFLVDLSGSNHTFRNGSTVLLKGRCWVQVNKIKDIANCTRDTVLPYREYQADVAVLMRVGVAIPFVVMFLQIVAVAVYFKNQGRGEDGWMLAFAERGVVGAFTEMYWRVCRRDNEGDIEWKVGDYPNCNLSWQAWIIVAIQDAFEGLVIPIVAIAGCSLPRFPVPAALIFLKGAKWLFDFAMMVYSCSHPSEPGEFNAQTEYWRVKTAEEAAKNAGPSHTSQVAV
jgi:hypothetical protein